MRKSIFTICMTCMLTAGCGAVEVKTETVSLEENIEKVSKAKPDKVSDKNITKEIKSVSKKGYKPAEYRTYTDENGKIKREIYTDSGDNFKITIPDGVTVYSLISVKNVMLEDGKHGGAQVPYINLNDDGTFEFVFGSTEEYRVSGEYTSDEGQLTLQSDKVYVFDYSENGMITFNEELSDDVPLENENAYTIDKHSTFFPAG